MASIHATTTTTATHSTLRSRQKGGAAAGSAPSSRPASLKSVSSASSLPAAHLSRRGSNKDKSSNGRNHGTDSSGGGRSSSTTNLRSVFPSESNLKGPWSKLQNFASTISNEILGLNEPTQPGGGGASGSGDSRNEAANRRRRKVARTISDGGIPALLANGARMRREELVCQKLEEDADSWMRDRGKRSRSPEPETRNSGDGQDKQALVYVHEVRKTDTLEGIVLIYNISAAALRRANRLWPNDSIHSRRHLFLPVTECLTRGRRLTPTEEASLPSESSDSPHYTHDSYVQLPTLKSPSEIVRLESSTLTHFPPRRKPPPSSSISTSTSTPESSTKFARNLPASLFMEPGVHPLDPARQRQAEQLALENMGAELGKVLDGVEKVGSVVEGFIRGLTKKAGDAVEGELIELTQGFRFSDEYRERERERERARAEEMASEASSSARRTEAEGVRGRRAANGAAKLKD